MPRPPKAEKPIFRSLVIATAATLPGEQYTDPNLARWIALRAGRYSLDMDASVTHLVCGPSEFKTNSTNARVRAALGSKGRVKVVTKDWLEDSMMQGRRLKEKGFELGEVVRREREVERRRVRVERGVEEGMRGVDPNLFGVYCDSTFFRYEVTIVNSEAARYEMTLYQSKTPNPHLYWFAAKYYQRKGDPSPKYYRPSPTSGLFWREFVHFETFFLKKTGVPWEKRLLGLWKEDEKPEDEGGLEPGRKWFWYEPPVSFAHF
ncbi:hypothetical protein B0T16DRAFT_328323 [Cercophora newfieldiana]|uniref:BRCT domain-containing protein n=1 Tax=Cercophora newfieldiana TaxID=92897 RepID=A0AA39Y6L3_9PEZI|nr:hypothetical protein B0T16DRAFT_328323 [Cercophora newfieldiana]